jgi:Uncharacterized protein conserved in bacteria (DUF2272)
MHNDQGSVSMRAAQIALQEWWYFGSQYIDGSDTALPILKEDRALPTEGRQGLGGFDERIMTYLRFGCPETSGLNSHDVETPKWSGAFISFCFRMAGSEGAFPYGLKHFSFVSKAVRNRLEGNLSAPLVAYHLNTIPKPGDLLWKHGWTPRSTMSYEDLLRHVRSDGATLDSHCDVVTSVDLSSGRLYAIGGCIKDRVLRLTVELDDEKHVVSPRYSAIVKLNI